MTWNQYESKIISNHPEYFLKGDAIRVRIFPRTFLSVASRHYKVEWTNDQGQPESRWDEDQRSWYFYKARLFAIVELQAGETVITFYGTEELPINALVNAFKTVISRHFSIDSGRIFGINTGTYKVVKLPDQDYKYVFSGVTVKYSAVLGCPEIQSETFVKYKRADVTEKTSDW